MIELMVQLPMIFNGEWKTINDFILSDSFKNSLH